ncbi:RagB/SusD family nutrient uptake outer membrane protein [Fulvivirgaceae bacterium PWU4]|uniref:RagB/SusD family nutrient uptake outer membrane protein n=1 Tax=Chryseosolibacter histidini TaxID=2782349 RepID=A0AAP2DTZ4_9BACT|nr:RagB/SusD family nutrient uptake outer membrane protein [Chryseosolibacter histidini]MBT1701293.1 RagB/SusD family nutrient uptake outer membrane protein [Chryseosolibacter histidini]
MKRRDISGTLLFILFLFLCNACQDFLNIDPPVSEIISETVFIDDRSATSAIAGIYSQMMSTSAFAGFDIGFYCAMSADDLMLLISSNEQIQFQNNSLAPLNEALLSSFWEPGYRYIWYANSVLEGLANSNGVSPEVKIQLLGEAKFIRAFCHFYLTNLFGSIPYITSTDYRVNAIVAKNSQAEVYDKLIQDLLESQRNLSDAYITNGRVRPNRGTVTALLARVYLYAGDWSNAEVEATKVINDSKYQLEGDLNRVFLADSKEAIWQLMPVNPGYNTFEIDYITRGSSGGLSLTNELLNSFEANDSRYDNWTSSWINSNATVITYFPFKYKVASLNQPITEYNTIFRLAEQFLIRAEARAQRGNLTGDNSAESDLNIVRNRAGLNKVAAVTQTEFLDAILQERRVELFSEWGHRWLDLKRMNKADITLGQLKPDWQLTDVLYPIPKHEIDKNKNLLPQNEGYQ